MNFLLPIPEKIGTGFKLETILWLNKTIWNEKSPTLLLNFLLPLPEKIGTGFGLETILTLEKTIWNEKSPTLLLNFLLPLLGSNQGPSD